MWGEAVDMHEIPWRIEGATHDGRRNKAVFRETVMIANEVSASVVRLSAES